MLKTLNNLSGLWALILSIIAVVIFFYNSEASMGDVRENQITLMRLAAEQTDVMDNISSTVVARGYEHTELAKYMRDSAILMKQTSATLLKVSIQLDIMIANKNNKLYEYH